MKILDECDFFLKHIIMSTPNAVAKIKGGEMFPQIYGGVYFYSFNDATALVCVIHNLPKTNTNIFGFHIHEGERCEYDFSSAGGHYGAGMHPNHKGDLPVVFSNGGDAFAVFCTNRFKVDEVLGRTMIVHIAPDDYTSQPAGNSGERVACGVIRRA